VSNISITDAKIYLSCPALAITMHPLTLAFNFFTQTTIAGLQCLNFAQKIACLHDQNNSVFLEGRLFSSQSELFESFLNCSVWLDKSRPFKTATFVLIMQTG